VSEILNIKCNGKRALFNMRTQVRREDCLHLIEPCETPCTTAHIAPPSDVPTASPLPPSPPSIHPPPRPSLQRVLMDGREYLPSRFEALCGRGDAKKWKTSIFVEVPGRRAPMMQDWLAQHGMTSAQLADLAANAQAHRRFHAHAEATGAGARVGQGRGGD
jgi:hypothetical protein